MKKNGAASLRMAECARVSPTCGFVYDGGDAFEFMGGHRHRNIELVCISFLKGGNIAPGRKSILSLY